MSGALKRRVLTAREYLRMLALAFLACDDGPSELALDKVMRAECARLGLDTDPLVQELVNELGCVYVEGDEIGDGTIAQAPPAQPARMTYGQALDALTEIANERGDTVQLEVSTWIDPVREITTTTGPESVTTRTGGARRSDVQVWSAKDRTHYGPGRGEYIVHDGPRTYEQAVRCYRERCSWPELQERDRKAQIEAERVALVDGGPDLSPAEVPA